MRLDLPVLAFTLMLSIALSMASFAGSVADTDADGIPDDFDNCILTANGPLGGACSTNQDGDDDGYGNACDCDFNNDGACGLDDLTYKLNNVGSTEPQLDINCDGAAGLDDTTFVLNSIGVAVGPSGLACSAANAKGPCPPL